MFLKDLTFFINANNASSILFEDMKNFKAEICLFCWVHFCFALLGYFQRRLQMNGISFILSSGYEAPPHHKCMMDACAQSEFSTHEALSAISHAKERSNKVCCNYTVVQQVLAYLKKYWNHETQTIKVQKLRNLEIMKLMKLKIFDPWNWKT